MFEEICEVIRGDRTHHQSAEGQTTLNKLTERILIYQGCFDKKIDFICDLELYVVFSLSYF